MAYPVELYCKCGAKAKYNFQTQASYDEYKKLWERDHSGKGHEQIWKFEHAKIVRQKKMDRL